MDMHAIQELLMQYGYLIILGWTFLEGETVVIVAGFLAAQGMFNPWLIALFAFLGSFASDQVMFSLGKYKGPAILKRFPRLDKNSEKARRLLVKYETPLILGFRFVYGIRNVTPILLGISGVSHLKFILLNMIGATVWALTFSFGGYFFGELFDKYAGNIKHAETWIIGGAVLGALVTYLIHRKRSKAAVEHALEVTGVQPPPKPENAPKAATPAEPEVQAKPATQPAPKEQAAHESEATK